MAGTEQVLALHSEIVGAVLAWHEQPDRWENHLRDLATEREAIIDADEIAAGGRPWQPPSVLGRVIACAREQDVRHPGDQQLDIGCGEWLTLMGGVSNPAYGGLRKALQLYNDAQGGAADWMSAALEEVFELAAEDDQEAQLEEAVQAMALLLRMAEQISHNIKEHQ